MTFSNGRSCEVALRCVNNLPCFYGFLIFCLCAVGSGPLFWSRTWGTARPASPPCASGVFLNAHLQRRLPFYLYLRRSERFCGLAASSFPHFCLLFWGFSSIFHTFSHPGSPLSPLPQVTARTDENFLKEKAFQFPCYKGGGFFLALLSTPLYYGL